MTTPVPPPEAPVAPTRRSFWRGPIPKAWALAALLGAAFFVARSRTAVTDETLPKLGQVPALSLTDHEGKPFGNDRLQGHVTIVNFIFTSCPTVCPLLTTRLAAVQQKLASSPGVRIVSISVDPDTDTPAVLKAYGTKHRADLTRWSFLTGPYQDIERIVMDGFKLWLHREKRDAGDGAFDVVHGEHFILVDRDGSIRGYYRAETSDLQRLERDARRLDGEPTS